MEELTDEARQPGDGQLPAAGAPVTPAPSNGTAPFVEVSLAECLAGNGGGPVLRLPARHVLRVDQEKATSQMNSALPVPTATGKIARKRPSWREPQD